MLKAKHKKHRRGENDIPSRQVQPIDESRHFAAEIKNRFEINFTSGVKNKIKSEDSRVTKYARSSKRHKRCVLVKLANNLSFFLFVYNYSHPAEL